MEKKQEIIEAGLYLLKTGLIARTWGNISARLNDEEFYITPSGKAYTDITFSDIPSVKIADCSYDKDGPKPSSEKFVHANAYKVRKDINYIVHTHQLYASAICAEEKDITLSDGTKVYCATYGLPGTQKLAKAVDETISNHLDCDIFLMAKHGTVVLGKTMQEALDKANYLEDECQKIFEKRCGKLHEVKNMKAYLDDYAQIVPAASDEDQEALRLVSEKNAAACMYVKDAKPLGFFDSKLQHLVYKFKYSKLKGK